MGEQDRSSRWIATLGLYFQGEAATASTSLQSGSYERSSKIFLKLVTQKKYDIPYVKKKKKGCKILKFIGFLIFYIFSFINLINVL